MNPLHYGLAPKMKPVSPKRRALVAALVLFSAVALVIYTSMEARRDGIASLVVEWDNGTPVEANLTASLIRDRSGSPQYLLAQVVPAVCGEAGATPKAR